MKYMKLIMASTTKSFYGTSIYLPLPFISIRYVTLQLVNFLFSYIQCQPNNIINSDSAKYFMFIQWAENNNVLICIKLWPFIPYALSHMSNKFFHKNILKLNFT